MNYIYEFASVAIVTGITGFFSDKLRGNIGKAVNFTSCLILMLCILAPVVSSIKGGGLSGNFPEINITEEIMDSEEYLQRLKKLTEEKLTLIEYRSIKSQFGYTEDDVFLEFSGIVENEAYELQNIILTIKSINALSKRDNIKEYLSEKYLCNIIVIEDIK